MAAWQQRWAGLSLERRFMIAASLVVGLSMLTLGYWVERRIRLGWVQGMAETGSLYLEAFLAPHVQVLDTQATLPEESRTAIQDLLSDKRVASRVAMVKVWSRDGELLFTTGRQPASDRLNASYLARLRRGQIIVNADKGNHRSLSTAGNLIEIYAPIYKRGTANIVAIGEFYEYSRMLDQESSQLRYATWFLILNGAVVIGVLLYATVRRAARVINTQRSLLETNLKRAAALAKRNNILRRAADRARLNATLLNESYLARIGADIHDGPIQLLSLAMLKLPDGTDGPQDALAVRADLEPLLARALADMRNLSAGLVLPEIEGLSTVEAMEFAIGQHEQRTGTSVQRSFGTLPEGLSEAVKVCAYRIVQEGLTNAYKHAGGRGQSVNVCRDGDVLDISVSNEGPLFGSRLAGSTSGRLGLRGMEMRVQALRGTLTAEPGRNGGMEVHARIPMSAGSIFGRENPGAS